MKKILLIFMAIFLLGTVSQAGALTFDLTYGGDYFLGSIIPGIPADETAEADYINTLRTVSPGFWTVVVYSPPPGSIRLFDRTDSDLAGPFPEASDLLASNVDVPSGGDRTLSADFSYVLGKYGSDSLVWYIGGLTGFDLVQLPSTWTSEIDTDGDGDIDVTYGGGLSHKTGFNPNPVPEPATMLLLGSGLLGLAGIGRKKFFKK